MKIEHFLTQNQSNFSRIVFWICRKGGI